MRIPALAFAGFVVIGTLAVVGTEEDDGALIDASKDLVAQSQALQDETDQSSAVPSSEDNTEDDDDVWVADEEEDSGWVADEELIDDTAGFDPNPFIEQPDEAEDGAVLVTDQ